MDDEQLLAQYEGKELCGTCQKEVTTTDFCVFEPIGTYLKMKGKKVTYKPILIKHHQTCWETKQQPQS